MIFVFYLLTELVRIEAGHYFKGFMVEFFVVIFIKINGFIGQME